MALSVLFTGGGSEGWSWGSLNRSTPSTTCRARWPVLAAASIAVAARPGSGCSSRSGPGSASSPAPWYGEGQERRRSSRSRWSARSSGSASSHHHLVAGDRRRRSAERHCPGTGFVDGGRHLLRPGGCPPGHLGRRHVQDPADDGLVRLRHGVPQPPPATSTRSVGERDPGDAKDVGRHPPDARLADVAGLVQTIFATTVVVLFFTLTGRDPYTGLYGLMAACSAPPRS